MSIFKERENEERVVIKNIPFNKKIILSGVYKIINNINEKVYVGSSKNIRKRCLWHRSRLNSNKHHNKSLQRSWNKYGEENFSFEIIEISKEEHLIQREQYWIDVTECYKNENGYNFNRDATKPNLNKKFSAETRAKLSNSKKGIKRSPETIEKLRIMNKGEGNPFYGKRHSEESKRKMSEKHIGKELTESQLESLKMGRGKRFHTEETYRKLSEANRGENSGTSKLKESEVIEILNHLKNKDKTYSRLAEEFGISITQISRIKNGLRWGYLKERMPELYEK